MSKEVFGSYNFILSIFILLSILSIPGLNTSVLRSVSKGFDGVFNQAVKLSFFWSLTGIPLFILIGSYFFFFEERIIGICFFCAAFIFPLYYSFNSWTSVLQGKKQFDVFAKYMIIQTVISTFAVIFALLLSNGNLIIIFVINLLMNAFFNIIFYLKVLKLLDNNADDNLWKSSGYKLSILNFSSVVYDNLDKVMVGLYLGPLELALYVIAVSITIQLKTLSDMTLKIFYPTVFQIEKKDLIKSFKQLISKMTFFYSLLTIIAILLAPFLITILYSSKYSDSIVYSQLYMITLPLSMILVMLNAFLISSNSENEIIKSSIIGIVLLFLLYATMIPLFKIYGAIIASVIYFIVMVVIQYKMLKSQCYP